MTEDRRRKTDDGRQMMDDGGENGVLKGGVWARWDSIKRASSCKKRSKTFENIRKYLKIDMKRLKIV